MKKQKIGFAALTKALAAKGATNPAGLAASIGRKKYGAKKMTEMSVKGRAKSGSRRGC